MAEHRINQRIALLSSELSILATAAGFDPDTLTSPPTDLPQCTPGPEVKTHGAFFTLECGEEVAANQK
jgi:hypothetical protein